MEFGSKWVHMARYGVILRLDGALWLTIIFKPLLTPKRAITIKCESYLWMFVTENVSMIWNVSVPRIVLLSLLPPPGKAVELSFDHKPASEVEKTRIEAAGGYLEESPGGV